MYSQPYRVSLIGHRYIERFGEIEEHLQQVVADLIKTKEYVEFFIGRNGDFDILAASVVKRAQEKYGKDNNSLILVIPYKIADLEYMENYYDEIWYPDELYGVHYKSAITMRNEWLVDHSDMLIAYVTKDQGGAYECMKKAQQKGIQVTLL